MKIYLTNNKNKTTEKKSEYTRSLSQVWLERATHWLQQADFLVPKSLSYLKTVSFYLLQQGPSI